MKTRKQIREELRAEINKIAARVIIGVVVAYLICVAAIIMIH